MFEWFSYNNLKEYASKCHLLLSPYQPVPVNMKRSMTESRDYEKLIGIYKGNNFYPNII